jgi:hypothetical protein
MIANPHIRQWANTVAAGFERSALRYRHFGRVPYRRSVTPGTEKKASQGMTSTMSDYCFARALFQRRPAGDCTCPENFFSPLTTRDVSILTTILERYEDQAGAFATLLREKLRDAKICFRDDIPGDAVTLNSRVTYRINGRIEGPHLVVQCQGEDLPDYAVSIHTLRGLSLLGLAEEETTME